MANVMPASQWLTGTVWRQKNHRGTSGSVWTEKANVGWCLPSVYWVAKLKAESIPVSTPQALVSLVQGYGNEDWVTVWLFGLEGRMGRVS